MPVYTEQIIDKKTGKKVDKLVEGKKQYYIRTYVTDESGNKKQITKHNKEWLGRDGEREAHQEEVRLQNKKHNKYEKITLTQLCNNYVNFISEYCKLSTTKKIKDNIKLYIKPFFKNPIISNIETTDIIKWHSFLADKHFSIKFIQNIHGTLVSILNHGCKFYNLEKNVASLAGNFKNNNSTKKRNEFFNH